MSLLNRKDAITRERGPCGPSQRSSLVQMTTYRAGTIFSDNVDGRPTALPYRGCQTMRQSVTQTITSRKVGCLSDANMRFTLVGWIDLQYDCEMMSCDQARRKKSVTRHYLANFLHHTTRCNKKLYTPLQYHLWYQIPVPWYRRVV